MSCAHPHHAHHHLYHHQWGLEWRSTDKSRVSPFGSALSSPRQITVDAAPIHMLTSRSIFFLTYEQDTEVLFLSNQEKAPFSGKEPWAQIWRCWFSSLPLHTRLLTDPAAVGGHRLMNPTGPHQLQKAETRSWGHRTGPLSMPRLPLEILSIKVMNRIDDKGQPWRKSNPHQKRVWFTASKVDQALTSVVQEADSPYKGKRHPILPENTP